ATPAEPATRTTPTILEKGHRDGGDGLSLSTRRSRRPVLRTDGCRVRLRLRGGVRRWGYPRRVRGVLLRAGQSAQQLRPAGRAGGAERSAGRDNGRGGGRQVRPLW